MDPVRIGKFILELRKEKKMTQQELAEKLGITDRAISKWENGRGMPDLSLMQPLCKELNITINELLCGERLTKKDYQEKLEENILNTIDYTDGKIKKNKRTFKIIIAIIVMLLLIFISMFLIDLRMMRQNKPVVFSTWGLKYTPAIDLHEYEIKMAIKKYLVEKGDNESKHHEGEKTFASMRVYLIDAHENNGLFNVYAWVNEGKYYLEKDVLMQDSGSSIPHKFIVKKINDEYIVTDFIIPRDGSDYSKDINSIFPKSVRNDIEKSNIDGTATILDLEVEEQAKLYFHK